MVAVLALLPVGSALAALFGERTGYHIPLLCFGHFVARFVRDSARCLLPEFLRVGLLQQILERTYSSVCILEVTKRN